ncbi:MAG: hypothetical protein ACRC9R_04690 [Enterovibrio sp.]
MSIIFACVALYGKDCAPAAVIACRVKDKWQGVIYKKSDVLILPFCLLEGKHFRQKSTFFKTIFI